MLNKCTLFLLLFTIWFTASFFSGILSIFSIACGVIVSILVVFFVFKTAIINSKTEFLFLQCSFYSYIFKQLNKNISNVFKICLRFLTPNANFISILDYVFLNRDSDAESAFTANLLTFLPGTIGILMKKRYLIVQSLDKDYFSLVEMYNITNEVGKLDDDSLV